MTKAKQEKALTMRQQLRARAEEQLDRLIVDGRAALDKVSMPHLIGGPSLAKLIAGGEQKTHRHQLVTHLANRAEAEVIKLWNNQNALFGEENGDD